MLILFVYMLILFLLCLLFLLLFSSFRYLSFVSFYRWLSLPFSRFLFVSLSLFPPLVLFLSLLLMFLFFLDLPSVAWFSLHFRFLFLPPSPLPSFPYLSLLFVPGVGLSSFSSSPSFSYFLFPFGYAGLSVSSLFSFPAFSLFLVRLRFFPCPFSTSCCLFFLLVCPLSLLL